MHGCKKIKLSHLKVVLIDQLDLAPNLVFDAAMSQRTSLKNRAIKMEEHLVSLDRQGLTLTVTGVRNFAEMI